METKVFFLFQITINILVGFSRFIWITMLWVCKYYKYFYSYSAEINFRRQNLTSKVDLRAVRVKVSHKFKVFWPCITVYWISICYGQGDGEMGTSAGQIHFPVLVRWAGQRHAPPPDTPPCGFLNEHCVEGKPIPPPDTPSCRSLSLHCVESKPSTLHLIGLLYLVDFPMSTAWKVNQPPSRLILHCVVSWSLSNTRHWVNVDLTLGQRRRPRANINPIITWQLSIIYQLYTWHSAFVSAVQPTILNQSIGQLVHITEIN